MNGRCGMRGEVPVSFVGLLEGFFTPGLFLSSTFFPFAVNKIFFTKQELQEKKKSWNKKVQPPSLSSPKILPLPLGGRPRFCFSTGAWMGLHSIRLHLKAGFHWQDSPTVAKKGETPPKPEKHESILTATSAATDSFLGAPRFFFAGETSTSPLSSCPKRVKHRTQNSTSSPRHIRNYFIEILNAVLKGREPWVGSSFGGVVSSHWRAPQQPTPKKNGGSKWAYTRLGYLSRGL